MPLAVLESAIPASQRRRPRGHRDQPLFLISVNKDSWLVYNAVIFSKTGTV
jgi:hypothetical protein